MNDQIMIAEMPEGDNPEYQQFVEKFEPKKTTDDCYTPENIYDAVAVWVAEEYRLDRSKFVRPFWPGGDYEAEEYPEGCVVVDNPPFSILSKICRFYTAHGIRFFLFGPTLTLFSSMLDSVCYLPCGISITYGNGAEVNTSFVTNLDDYQVRTCPELYQRLRLVDFRNKKQRARDLPKYSYPPYVLTAAMCYIYSKYGVDYRLNREESYFIRALDAQKAVGKTIFGSGLLLSERAAAERAAAERAAAERAAAERAAAEKKDAVVWPLSIRERAIVRALGGESGIMSPEEIDRAQVNLFGGMDDGEDP